MKKENKEKKEKRNDEVREGMSKSGCRQSQ